MAAYEDYYRDKAKEWTDSDHTFHIHLGTHKRFESPTENLEH